MIVYISIGNSDDKLSQAEWSTFVSQVDRYIESATDGHDGEVHGRWFSASDAPWQNACWCVEFHADDVASTLRGRLPVVAASFGQDSIAWAEVKTTEFLGAKS